VKKHPKLLGYFLKLNFHKVLINFQLAFTSSGFKNFWQFSANCKNALAAGESGREVTTGSP
jgi:hypothetical protein